MQSQGTPIIQKYIYIDNSTRVLCLSPKSKVWLILCCYDLSLNQENADGIDPRVVNSKTGEIIELQLSERRVHILTDREKEILNHHSISFPTYQNRIAVITRQ